ncbi:Acyl-CoA dehydrogenase, N-terminal domain [Thermomonospora echinospora]|uniref:Acyl-CoA dehydrogenase, N-terminal domain n=1 Tax=Thermomonospora echinospora TaxID=1992 RepID=A0A1H6E8B1_9ACTN|nr:acyl-CoA dehydrogenase family protein [Thermomonospora echinospora]SEG93962.1 Acyl-CoA dehydrogenase, N-terminal domain [Thermomonospora echinospora]
MSDHLEDLAEAVRGVLSSRRPVDATAPAGLDTALWKELEQLGFTSLALPEELGGGGGTVRDAAVLVREAASACAAVPVAEAAFVAAPMLAAAGARPPNGPLTAAPGDLYAEPVHGGTWRITGSLSRVPWLRSAGHVVTPVTTPDGPAVAVVPVGHRLLRLVEGTDLAGEQRDGAVLEGVETDQVFPLPAGTWRRDAELYGAAARALQMAGAARGVLEATLRHVGERVQFGRPLVRFQAVQHQLAALAADVVTVEVSADAAILALLRTGYDRELMVASAKAEASALARSVAAVGHQLHGAIGFTMEHRLGAYTRRLWSWRDEYGNELYWHRRIAELVADRGGDVWGLVADADRRPEGAQVHVGD